MSSLSRNMIVSTVKSVKTSVHVGYRDNHVESVNIFDHVEPIETFDHVSTFVLRGLIMLSHNKFHRIKMLDQVESVMMFDHV